MTPMVRVDGHDYFIYEPAMLRDGRCCIPVRWFTRGGQLFAKSWELHVVATENAYGWRVIQSNNFEIAASDLLKNFIDLKNDAGTLYTDLPSPANIIGEPMPVLIHC